MNINRRNVVRSLFFLPFAVPTKEKEKPGIKEEKMELESLVTIQTYVNNTSSKKMEMLRKENVKLQKENKKSTYLLTLLDAKVTYLLDHRRPKNT